MHESHNGPVSSMPPDEQLMGSIRVCNSVDGISKMHNPPRKRSLSRVLFRVPIWHSLQNGFVDVCRLLVSNESLYDPLLRPLPQRQPLLTLRGVSHISTPNMTISKFSGKMERRHQHHLTTCKSFHVIAKRHPGTNTTKQLTIRRVRARSRFCEPR